MFTLRASHKDYYQRKAFERCNLNEKNAVYAPNRHESKLVI